jgi:Tol biopolymer transport system component
MRRRLILGLGLGLTAAFAAVAATAPASDALKGKPTCGPSAWVPREQAPMASHDGRVLAWSTQFTQNRFMRRVFVSTPDGSNVRPVSVPGLGNDEARALAPDGSQVLIERIGDPGRLILASTRAAEARVVIDAEADKLRRLWGRAPQWSPDGRFRVDADDEGLLVVPAGGGPLRRIPIPETDENDSATWSPDGQRIAFRGWSGDAGWTGPNLYVVRADGSGLRGLTESGTAGVPQWSPDGSLIALVFDDTDIQGGTAIGVVRPDGSGRRLLTKPHEGPDRRSASQVSWINSRTLVFASYQQRQGPRKVVDIHTIRTDGRGERRLTYQCHLGSRADDRLSGSLLGDTIQTFAGNDEVAPGRGADDVDAGSGNDLIQAALDGVRDLIRCGSGRDRVIAERRDRIARDCERVTRLAR